MPILGRSGESLGTRLFGPAGRGEASKKIFSKDVVSNVYNRAKKGYQNAGGFLGPTAHAAEMPVVYSGTPSGPRQNYSPVQVTPTQKNFSINTDPGLGGGSEGGGGKVSNFKTDGSETQSELDFLRKKQLGAISDEYESESKRLRDVENRARSAYDQSLSQAQAYYPEFQRLIGEQQASTEGQIGNLENQRKYESERALGQARQLLADLNRRQYAQMSATGNYGSSVPEAFADQFGNKAYAAQAGIQQSRDAALNELSSKRIEAKQYFDGKLAEGKQKYDTLISSLQQQLNAQLDQIGQAKGQAASAKRAQSLEAWNNYVNNKFSLDQELRNYQNQLIQYQAQQTALEDDSTNPLATAVIPGVDSSANSQILGDITGKVQQNANPLAMSQAPIYSKRKLSPEEQQLYGNDVGLQLNSPIA